VIRIFTDGSGRRSDGTGSGYAWFRQDTGEKKIVRENGLTNNQAEYRAIRSAIEALPALPSGTRFDLYTEIHHTIATRELTVQFIWVPRRENLAGKLL
jgi:ribonuclease HI